MQTKIKSIVTVLLALAIIISTLGCHTIEGAGRDIERGGEAIQDAAD